MKKVLIISNEERANCPELIPNAESFGLEGTLYNIENLKNAILSLGEYEVEIIHHSLLDGSTIISADRIILSGVFAARAIPLEEMWEMYRKEIEFIRSCKIPILGICMGLQLIAMAFDPEFNIERIEPDGEFGFVELEKLTETPILEGLTAFSALEMHRCRVSSLSEGFRLCASSSLCQIQVIEHESRPIWGVQFHPELLSSEHRDGLRILKNFLEL